MTPNDRLNDETGGVLRLARRMVFGLKSRDAHGSDTRRGIKRMPSVKAQGTNAIARAARLREAQERIAWIEAHPAFSSWLKEALRGACDRDPVEVLNDLEILGHLLRGWASAVIEEQREASGGAAQEETGRRSPI
jgi:hypothetical protein